MRSELTAILMLSLAVSCGSYRAASRKPAMTDLACLLLAPITTHGNKIKRLDARTLRAIETHNTGWDLLCHKTPSL